MRKKFPYSIGKIHAVHNGVDPRLQPAKKSSTLTKRYAIGSSTITLLFMGLFIQRKNPLFLLPIVRTLINEGLDIRLLLCGKGELEMEIKKEINRLDLSKNVFIVPPVYGIEKNKVMNVADIFVHPSLNEGFSLAVIEAMAVGLPVVINDGFSSREAVIDGITGFVCKKQTQWYLRLERLITDISLRRICGKNAIKKVRKEFTWEHAVGKHVAWFEQLLASPVYKKKSQDKNRM